ncbi:MAG: glycosyltransferase family 2 protein [Cyclobacteriaceae bacterium]|nr:glycosyltransferase family 2 protein [Cyclobacteriaceae bacterium]
MPNKIDISVIVPLFNEEESIRELAQWIKKVMDAHNFTYEVIFVDDGSNDSSWEKISEINSQNSNCKGIKFNRNYGKSAALHTGFQQTNGEVVVTMDADLQDSPDEIPALYKMIKEEGYELVSGWKKKRHDPITKTIPSKFFNGVTRIISGIKLHDFNCGLKAYDQRVVKNIRVYGEMHRYIPVIANWNGFSKIGEKVVEHRERKYGTTKFGIERFVNGFLDLLSITFVSKFKKQPMHFFGMWGTISFLFGFVFTLKVIWDKLSAIYIYKTPVVREITDQPLFFLALVALVVGVQLFLAGFLAEMLTMNFSSRSEYIVSERIGVDK